MNNSLNRRAFIQGTMGAGAGVALAAASPGVAEATDAGTKYGFQNGFSPWPLSLNTSTIRPATLEVKIDAAAEAGYDAIEIWERELKEHEDNGGNLKELAKSIRDKGLFVPNVIGMWDGMPATREEFDASLEVSRNRMRMAADVGSQHIAALPFPDREDFDLAWGAEMYRELLRIGREDYNIIAAQEYIGFVKGVHRLGQACAIGIDANDPDACLVADTFHLYRGGSGFNGIQHLNGNFFAVFHWNDVGPEKPREEVGDADRLYPGDGILPLVDALRSLYIIGYRGPLSLELFNRAHWEQDPKQVAKTGLERLRANVAETLGTLNA